MAQAKFLYIVDHYVPFPKSEYGGVWNVIAESDEECFDLIAAEDTGNFYESYYGDLRENIMKCDCFEVLADESSRVVYEFTT